MFSIQFFSRPEIALALSPAEGVFENAVPPAGWERKNFGPYLAVGEIGGLPSRGSSAVATTRMRSPEDREATIVPDTRWLWQRPGGPPAIDVLIWVNGNLVHDSAAVSTSKTKPFRIRKGVNTLTVECRSAEDATITPWNVRLEFADARDGRPIEDMIFDVERR